MILQNKRSFFSHMAGSYEMQLFCKKAEVRGGETVSKGQDESLEDQRTLLCSFPSNECPFLIFLVFPKHACRLGPKNQFQPTILFIRKPQLASRAPSNAAIWVLLMASAILNFLSSVSHHCKPIPSTLLLRPGLCLKVPPACPAPRLCLSPPECSSSHYPRYVLLKSGFCKQSTRQIKELIHSVCLQSPE